MVCSLTTLRCVYGVIDGIDRASTRDRDRSVATEQPSCNRNALRVAGSGIELALHEALRFAESGI
jgi:hypothetical protein